MRLDSASTRGLTASTFAGTLVLSAGSWTSAAWPMAMRFRSLSATCATTCSCAGSPSSSKGSPPGATVAPTATRIDTTTPLLGALTTTRPFWPAPIRPAACRARSCSVRASFRRTSASCRSCSSPTPFSTISTLRLKTISAAASRVAALSRFARVADASALSIVSICVPALTTSPARTCKATTRPATVAPTEDCACGRKATRPGMESTSEVCAVPTVSIVRNCFCATVTWTEFAALPGRDEACGLACSAVRSPQPARTTAHTAVSVAF